MIGQAVIGRAGREDGSGREERAAPVDRRGWLLVIVGAAALGRLGVADHSLWFDEQASAFFSDQPFARLWSDWMLRETNPPLYYSMLRAWRAVFGSSDLAIRALSVAASLAAIVLISAVARRAYGARAGLIAAGLAALSGRQLYFAEQARAYIFVLCAVLVAIGALLAFGATDDARRRWRCAALFAAAAVAGIYLHTTMLLFPAIAATAVVAADPLRYARRPALLLPLVAAGVAILLAAGWAIRIAVLQMHAHDNFGAGGLFPLRSMLKCTLQTLFLSAYDGKMSYRMILPILALALVLAFVALDRRRRETRFLAATGGLAIVAFMAIGTAVPIFSMRSIFWISAVPLILAAGALARIPAARGRWGALAVVAVLLVVDTGHLAATLEEEDWNTPVRRLAAQPRALLLVQGEAMALLADETCRRRLRLRRCPYAIVAVTDPLDRFDGWARGLFAGPRVPATKLADVAAGRQVFLFRKAVFHDLPELLHRDGRGRGVPAGAPPLIGPLPAAALR